MIDIRILPDCIKMAQLHQGLLSESEREGRSLLRYIRANRSGKSKDRKLTLFLLPQAEESLLKMISVEDKLAELEKDAEEFRSLLGNYPNIRMLADAFIRERNKIDRSAKDARISYEQALRNHRDMEPSQVEMLDSLKESRMKADRIKVEVEPVAADLKNRLTRCREILSKYS